MKSSITYAEAHELWNKYITTPHLRVHMLQSEAVMRKLAKHFNADADFWGIAGLLHDLDLDKLGLDYTYHGYTTVEILREEGYEIPELFDAIVAHTEGVTNAKRNTNFDIILAAAENITGIITAYVLILPDKKVAGVKASSIKKRLKQLRFAASVNREFIYDIEKAGIQLDDFLTLAIEGISEIAEEVNM